MQIEITDTFQFKRFKISQNNLVFRVNSEAILLVSWIKSLASSRILEIGSGTGIISIALDYKFNHQNIIHCIDIDRNAYEMTRYNVEENHSLQIKANHISLEDFTKHTDIKYDVVVSNPPFFGGSYKSEKARNKLAKYTDSLSYEDLLISSCQVLTESGCIYLVLPSSALESINQLSDKLELSLVALCFIEPKIGRIAKRVLIELSKEKNAKKSETTIAILDEKGNYTEAYRLMTGEFYTIF